MRGRKPTPTSVLKTRNTLRRKRHASRAHEPQPRGDLVEPPAWMAPGQAECWRYAIEHAPANVLRLIDAGTLATYCVAQDRHRRAAVMQAKLDETAALPLLTKSRDGTAVLSPYLRAMDRAADIMLRAAAELGFTPASRPRLVGTGAQPTLPDPQSPWAKLRVLQGGLSDQPDDKPPPQSA